MSEPLAPKSRADLLKALHTLAVQDTSAPAWPTLLGYVYEPTATLDAPQATQALGQTGRKSTSPTLDFAPVPVQEHRARIVGVIVHQRHQAPKVERLLLPPADESLADADYGPRLPQQGVLPLQPLSSPKAFLLQSEPALRHAVAAGIDWDTVVQRIARAQVLTHLPKASRQRAHPAIWLVLDRSRRLDLYLADLELAAHTLCKGVANSALESCVLLERSNPLAHKGATRVLASDAPPTANKSDRQVLVFSDLGQLTKDARPRLVAQWEAFLHKLCRLNNRVLVISPVPLAGINLPKACEVLVLGVQNNSQPLRQGPQPSAPLEQALNQAYERLKTCLAFAVSADQALLRAMRRLDPFAAQHAELEDKYWNDPDVHYSLSRTLKAPAATALRQNLHTWPVQQQLDVLRVLQQQHAGLPQSVEYVECLLWEAAASKAARTLAENDLKPTRQWLQRLRTTMGQPMPGLPMYAQSVWNVVRSDASTQARCSQVLVPIWAAQRQSQIEPVPAAFHPDDVQGLGSTPPPLAPTPTYWLVCQGPVYLLQNTPPNARQGLVHGPITGHSWQWRAGSGAELKLSTQESVHLLRFASGETFSVDTEIDHLTLAPLSRPHWATSLSQGYGGLILTLPDLIQGQRQVPVTPEWAAAIFHKSAPPALPFKTLRSTAKDKRGSALALTKYTPLSLTQGLDETGLFADLAVGEVVQRLRYIPPGRFLMGSPEQESASYSDEHPQHEVVITQGFWLADTACTQALWWEVMGNRPSTAGKGDDLPVDTVSWRDVQAFTQQLSRWLQGMATAAHLAIDLPTEAQWEYACRAGSATPFHWGNEATRAHANFDGEFPYGSEEKGEKSTGTEQVKRYLPNAWGLWQMHGDVWEWCKDGQRTYTSDAATAVDPVGVVNDDKGRRCLRGGSWISHGWSLRSADRAGYGPDVRRDSIGFRFLLRSQAQ